MQFDESKLPLDEDVLDEDEKQPPEVELDEVLLELLLVVVDPVPEVDEVLLEADVWAKACPASISTAISELILRNVLIVFSLHETGL